METNGTGNQSPLAGLAAGALGLGASASPARTPNHVDTTLVELRHYRFGAPSIDRDGTYPHESKRQRCDDRPQQPAENKRTYTDLLQHRL